MLLAPIVEPVRTYDAVEWEVCGRKRSTSDDAEEMTGCNVMGAPATAPAT